MASDTLQGKIEPRLAISLTRTEALAFLAHVSGEHAELALLVRDVRDMAARRGWRTEVRDVPHVRATEPDAD